MWSYLKKMVKKGEGVGESQPMTNFMGKTPDFAPEFTIHCSLRGRRYKWKGIRGIARATREGDGKGSGPC